MGTCAYPTRRGREVYASYRSFCTSASATKLAWISALCLQRSAGSGFKCSESAIGERSSVAPDAAAHERAVGIFIRLERPVNLESSRSPGQSCRVQLHLGRTAAAVANEIALPTHERQLGSGTCGPKTDILAMPARN